MSDSLPPAFNDRQLPGWRAYATASERERLRDTQVDAQHLPNGLADWFSSASAEDRQALLDSQAHLHQCRRELADLLDPLHSITDFAEPLLKARLQADFGLAVDVHRAQWVRLSRVWTQEGRRQEIFPQQQSLLQAALQNFPADATFTADDCLTLDGAFTLENDAIFEPASVTFTRPLGISPAQFAQLCRSLDLGQRYQQHLSAVYDAPVAGARIREASVRMYKALVQVRSHVAFLQAHLSSAGRETLASLLQGEAAPLYHGSRARVVQVSLYGVPLAEAWVVVPGQEGSVQSMIVYLPGARHPLKEYASLAAFKQDLRRALGAPAFRALLRGYAARHQAPAFASLMQQHLFHRVAGEHDPVYNPEAMLTLRSRRVEGDLFETLQDQHRARLGADAAVLVVPSRDANQRAAASRLEFWQRYGMNGTHQAALFLASLSEVMAGVMAERLIGKREPNL